MVTRSDLKTLKIFSQFRHKKPEKDNHPSSSCTTILVIEIASPFDHCSRQR